ncbi:MAG TPA: hypothetical protein VFR47_01155 [Anaerolineales bacterium]|nr:hypothetical protein [Anaerolineales bacterium]
MESKSLLFEKVERLKSILVARATGQIAAEFEYETVRRELVASSIRDMLPKFILTNRTLGEFWNYIQPKFATYKERREFLKIEFAQLLSSLEFGETNKDVLMEKGDLFAFQFPAGMPFGLQKPNLAFVPARGTQLVKFEDSRNIGVLRNEIYPNLTYLVLSKRLENTPVFRKEMLNALREMNQTDIEKRFFDEYCKRYYVREVEVPMLIPQAWIQWHSLPKKDLRSQSSTYIDDLYRVDFVVFWNYKRYAILIDDIGHYAIKTGPSWMADQEKYSKRLKEDRKLRKEGWNVFRASNWEIRHDESVKEILDDLQDFIGFEIPKPKPPPLEAIPF